MKKYKLIVISIILFLVTFNVKAMNYNDVKNRNVCSNFEVALSANKNLTKVNCYNDYNSAKQAFDALSDKSAVILERKNNETKFINAKLGLVYLDIGDTLTYYYSDKTLKNDIYYVDHNVNYGATDGVLLDFNYDNHAIKVKSSSMTGWVKNGYYKIVPLSFIGNVSYYKVTNTELLHYYSGDIRNYYTQGSRAIDKKPSMLAVGNYYSYDGNYFYSNLEDLITDYKSGNYNHSVNKNNPYYNYYMYLPHRGKTNYSSDDIDAYLKNTRGLIGTIYGKMYVDKYSNMFGTGIYFKSAENLYGANAILMMSLATNESAIGQSKIAREKNNLFGHNATDGNAYNNATGYLNAYQSIIYHANSWINCGYAKPTDWRYHGSNMGNKSIGMNVMYASDPYWGEKAANYYYQFDKQNGFLDYNYYQLGITDANGTNTLNVRKDSNTYSSPLYTVDPKNTIVIILGEEKGQVVNGSDVWYKVVSDANLNNLRNSIMGCSTTNYYNWNSYAYIHSSYVKKINQTQNGKYNNNNLVTENNYTYKEYSSGTTYTPKVGLINSDTKVYDTATLNSKLTSNKIIKKGHLTPVFMEAKDESGKVVAYLVMEDYSKNQRGWVSASALTFSDKDILKVTLSNPGDYIDVYKEPGKTDIGNIYDNTFSVITDKTTYNNEVWLKIYYGIDNTMAWVKTNNGNMSYTTDKINQAPVITAKDIVTYKGLDFDPLKGVSAYDSEDGDLTKNIKVTKNTVNKDKPGTYEVTYEVVDKKGEKVTKTIKVTVQEFREGNSFFIYESLTQTNKDTFEFKGLSAIKKQNNRNMVHELVFTNEDTKENYTYKMGEYKDYPYDASSLDDDKKYDYSGGWFKGSVDLSKLPNGNYTVKIISHNNDTGYYVSTYFTNISNSKMPRRIKAGKGYAFEIDYTYVGAPMVISVRNDLLSYDIPETLDPMYNFFNELKLNNNTLSITGTSHNAMVSYSKNDTIKREIVFENKSNYQRYSYDIGYTDNGLYKVELAVSDNKDKTRAWFKKDIDLSKLPKGDYVIYIKTTSNNKTYYGELMDVANTNFKNINTSKYEFKRVNEKRLRLELTVK